MVSVTSEELRQQEINARSNVGLLFFILMNVQFPAIICTVLTFPQNIHVFLKERNTGW